MSETKPHVHVDIGPEAAERLAAFCARRRSSIRIIADVNTWKAMGEEVERSLKSTGLATRATVFDEPYLAADARSIFRLLVDDDPSERLYVAVGSGTITDIARFASHRTGRDFVCMATAPSVDAYASIVAPMIVDGVKRTFPASAPLAVFADSEALAAAPKPMIAAGFGDMICKFSAVADWRLGELLWGESFDEPIARRSESAARACADAAGSIGERRPEGLAVLMTALVESGLCMAEAGNSRPASGAEHQYSHYWEMRLLSEGRPPILHGLKVGIGTLEAARLWDAIRSLSKMEATAALANSRPASRPAEERRIRTAYGAAAGETIACQERFLSMKTEGYEALKTAIIDSWDAILGFARGVPSAEETERLMRLAGCPTDPRELGLNRKEIGLSLSSSHYIRDRFTVKKLALMLGIE
jgi:Glycerol dehydrogenase and related enzymes